MTETTTAMLLPALESLEQIMSDIVAPTAAEIDQHGTFPLVALEALGGAGLLGLISAKEVGGQGHGHRAAVMLAGTTDAACLIKGNYATWLADNTFPAGVTRILAETIAYDHCNVTVGPAANEPLVARFHALLMAMSYADPELQPLMDLEGLKQWRDGRVEGYRPLEAAVDSAGFYDHAGTIIEDTYQY